MLNLISGYSGQKRIQKFLVLFLYLLGKSEIISNFKNLRINDFNKFSA